MNTTILLRRTLFSVLLLGLSFQMHAQVLPEIVITAKRYKYLNAVSPEEAAQPVSMVQQYAAEYDLKGAEFYEEEADNYFVSFFIPEGKILATYSADGTLLQTAERYKNVALPASITKAVASRFPKWTIAKDVYLVTYQENGNTGKKVYKLLLQNGSKRMRVKVNDQGTFL